MATTIKTTLAEWSITASSNKPDATDAADIDADLRQIQAVVRQYLANKGANIAASATVNLAAATGNYVHVTHATTTVAISALSTVAAGLRYLIVFDVTSGTLTLTHSATALILPGAADITVANGDRAEFVSLGSGNWRCLWYQPAAGYQGKDATLTALAGTLTAANKIPYATALDTAGELTFNPSTALAASTSTVPSQTVVKTAVDDLIANCSAATPDSAADYFVFEDATDSTQKKALLSTIASGISVGTAQASTSGTAILFTGISSAAKRITLFFSGMSTDGVSHPIVQIGDAGGIEATGYLGGAGADGISANSTVGFLCGIGGGSTQVFHGVITLIKISGNTWVSSGTSGRSDAALAYAFGGSKTLSATLTQLHLTTESGDTFDAGTVNILVE